MHHFAGNWPPTVHTAVPVLHRVPSPSRTGRFALASLRAGPPRSFIAPSTPAPPWQPTLAAFTMASPLKSTTLPRLTTISAVGTASAASSSPAEESPGQVEVIGNDAQWIGVTPRFFRGLIAVAVEGILLFGDALLSRARVSESMHDLGTAQWKLLFPLLLLLFCCCCCCCCCCCWRTACWRSGCRSGCWGWGLALGRQVAPADAGLTLFAPRFSFDAATGCL